VGACFPTYHLSFVFFSNLPARDNSAQCVDDCITAFNTCCEKYLRTICLEKERVCIKTCLYVDNKATFDFDSDNDGLRGHPIKPVVEEDAFITNLSSLTIAFNEASHHQSDNIMCTVNCETAWDTCCNIGMPNPYNCLSDFVWLNGCSTKCNNCYKSCGFSGSCPTPGEKETTNEVTTDFDNNNDGVERSGRFIEPIVTEDA
jgi:hypothetical protein